MSTEPFHNLPVESFTVGGDFNKFYPIVFRDLGWDVGALDLEISRVNTHTDSQWRGSFWMRLTWHSSNWGHGSEFYSIQARQTRQIFLGGFKDAYFNPLAILWLRGGNTTYHYRANQPVELSSVDAVDNKMVFEVPAHNVRVEASSKTQPDPGYADWDLRKDSHPDLFGSHIHRGMVMMWQGSNPPSGWALCDGSNGTPDLRGRFVLGAGQGAGLTNRGAGQTGGAETHTLATREMPAHSHEVIDPGHSHHIRISGGDDAFHGSADMGENTAFQANTSVSTTGIQVGPTGDGAPHNNMPPYYVLAYIMKL